MELVPRTTAPLHATGAVEFVPLAAISADAAFRLREPGDVSGLAGSIARLGQLAPVELRPLPGAGDGPVRFQVVAGFRRLAAVRLLSRGRVLARVHARLDEEDAWSLALTQALLGRPLAVAELEALRARLAERRLAPWAEELLDAALHPAPDASDDGGAAEDAASSAAEVVDDGDGHVAPRFQPAGEAPAQPAGEAPAQPAGEAQAQPAGEAQAQPAGEAQAQPTGEARAQPAEEEVTAEALAADLAGRLWQVNQDLSLLVDAWDELPDEARRMILEQARYMADLHPYLSRGPAR